MTDATEENSSLVISCCLGKGVVDPDVTVVSSILAVVLSYERPRRARGFVRGRALGDWSHRCCFWAFLGLVPQAEFWFHHVALWVTRIRVSARR